MKGLYNKMYRNFMIMRRISNLKSKESKQFFEEGNSVNNLCNHLSIPESKAQFICFKYPYIKKFDNSRIKLVTETICDLGYKKNDLVSEPSLFSLLPITLKYRYTVLRECGFQNISTEHLLSYLTIMKKRTIGDLKKCGMIMSQINIENQLATYMTQWPTSLSSDIITDVNELTMYSLRLKLIQRYLELLLDLTEVEFQRGIETYPTLKHRPLKTINETFNILKSEIMLPTQKLKANFYLLHADPENLKCIIYKVKTIGGIDVKEVIRMHPKLALKNYLIINQIKEILKDYGISDEAQSKCLEIFTLGPETVKERLEHAKSIPEFNTFWEHPRFLKMIHYNKIAMKRLMSLYKSNKKCLSLNVLSGSSLRYEIFEKSPGDRLGKGKDLVFCIKQSLGGNFSSTAIRNILKRHPFWINIPLVQVKYVHKQLSADFSSQDIFENCPVLLYPWNKLQDTLKEIKRKPKASPLQNYQEQLDFIKLTKSQTLSLALYTLEKRHYFSGNGVWSEDKSKTQNSVQNERALLN